MTKEKDNEEETYSEKVKERASKFVDAALIGGKHAKDILKGEETILEGAENTYEDLKKLDEEEK